MTSMVKQRTYVQPSRRVEALMEELGRIVDPSKLVSIRSASFKDFLRHLVRVATLFPLVDTSRCSSYYTKLFLIALYEKPPILAFVDAKIRHGKGRVKVISRSGNVYELRFDGASKLLGPAIKRVGKEKSLVIVVGSYVPVSAKYFVSPKLVEGADPTYRVTDGKRARWFVYNASTNPVPFNVATLLYL